MFGCGEFDGLDRLDVAGDGRGMSPCSRMKFFTNFGTRPLSDSPSMSCRTSTWPSVSLPAPMPITGICTARVMRAASSLGTHSSSSMAAPAASSDLASLQHLL